MNKNNIMKEEKTQRRIKLLIATGKTKPKALKQARNWFKRNPNRKIANLKMDKETITIRRSEALLTK